MPYRPNASPFRKTQQGRARRPSVMFLATYEDGSTAYFVVEGHGGSDEDYRALGIAQERQRAGELLEGVIRTVKRVR
jgi:hypothetical protein